MTHADVPKGTEKLTAWLGWPVGIARPRPAARPLGGLSDYICLLKPRVMSLVVFTGWVGLYLAPGHLDLLQASIAVLSIAVGSGAAGCINMWYERDIDALMSRTRNRPLPRGRIAPADALLFGITLSLASIAAMAAAVNLLAAALLALATAFYVFIYTIWLKRRTPQNIVIGGAAGALPPVIGWAAATGQVGGPALALFALIFLWTPPHFWALALFRAGDYAKAGVPMLPVVRGGGETRRQILLYTIALWPASLAPALMGIASWAYGAAALALSLVFTMLAIQMLRDPSERACKKTFGFSLLYLFAIFALLAIDHAARAALG